MLHSHGRVYEYGDKNGKLLEHQLRCQAVSRLIPEIKNKHDTLVMDPRGINKVFELYYSKLYT